MPKEICLIILMFFFLLNCTDNNQMRSNELNSKIILNNNYAAIKAFCLKGFPCSEKNIEKIFNGKSETCLILYNKYDSELMISFSKPVYIAEILLFSKKDNEVKNYKRALNLHVSIHKDNTKSFFGIGVPVRLTDKEPYIITSDNKNKIGLLKTKTLIIEIDDMAEKWKDSVLKLCGLKIKFSNNPIYRPSITMAEIINRYVKDNLNKPWNYSFSKISDSDDSNLEFDVMSNLMYYGLSGNTLAENVFMNFQPGGTVNNEFYSNLKEWYSVTKGR